MKIDIKVRPSYLVKSIKEARFTIKDGDHSASACVFMPDPMVSIEEFGSDLDAYEQMSATDYLLLGDSSLQTVDTVLIYSINSNGGGLGNLLLGYITEEFKHFDILVELPVDDNEGYSSPKKLIKFYKQAGFETIYEDDEGERPLLLKPQSAQSMTIFR